MANVIELVLKASNQASGPLTKVAGELGALDAAGRKAAAGGLGDVQKAIPGIATSILSLTSMIPGLGGVISQAGLQIIGVFTRWQDEADKTVQTMTRLAERVQATFEETQAEVARIRAEAAGKAGEVIEQQYARELAAIEKNRLKQIATAKGSVEEIAAIEAEAAGKRLIAAEQLEAQLGELTKKRVELARELGTQVAEAEAATTQALLEEQGKRLQALDVGTAQQMEKLKAAHQKQLEEIAKRGGSEREQYELRRQAQEAFDAKSLQQTTDTEIKRRAIIKEQGEFLKTLASSAREAEASLAVAVAESQKKTVEAVQLAATDRQKVLDAEYQQVLERISKRGLTEQQALEARLNAERAYHAQSQQLAVDTAAKKLQLVTEAAEKEAAATAKAAAEKKERDDKYFNDWLENLKLIKAAQEMVVQSTASVADAEAKATAAVLEGQGQRLEALESTSKRAQELIEEQYLAEIKRANETAMQSKQRQELLLNAQREFSAKSLELTSQTEQQRRQIVESSVQSLLGSFRNMGAGFEEIQKKLTFATLITETQKAIQAILELSKALAAGDQTLKAAGLTQQDFAQAIQGLTQNLQAQAQAINNGTAATQQNTAASSENIRVLSDGTRVLSEQQASWAALGDQISRTTGQLTSWAAAERAAKGQQAKTISTPLPRNVRTAQEAWNWMMSGQASITPASQFKQPGGTSRQFSAGGPSNNININVGSVNDKQTIQTLANTVSQSINDAERRRLIPGVTYLGSSGAEHVSPGNF